MTVWAIYGRYPGRREWRLRTWRETPDHAEFSTRWFVRPNYQVRVVPLQVAVVGDIPRTLATRQVIRRCS